VTAAHAHAEGRQQDQDDGGDRVHHRPSAAPPLGHPVGGGTGVPRVEELRELAMGVEVGLAVTGLGRPVPTLRAHPHPGAFACRQRLHRALIGRPAAHL
jgi:hypothetical protein